MTAQASSPHEGKPRDTASRDVSCRATAAPFGLLPGSDFVLAEGGGVATGLPQALWYFRNEAVAVPAPGTPIAGFAPGKRLCADIAEWQARMPLGSPPEYPPLIRMGAASLIPGARIVDPGTLYVGERRIPYELAPRLPSNSAWPDASSLAFLRERTLRLRGDFRDATFVTRTLWPEDFRLPATPAARPLDEISADALRRRVRELPLGGARSPFSAELLWRRAGAAATEAGAPVLAFILNGAQGDDDEAHAGHFAVVTGRIGTEGEIGDWLVANYYALDTVSEKGIIAAPLPLDNYLADVNAGQSWYRPSCMLVAVLREPRTAIHAQSALFRAYNQYYRHQFRYHHARANCAGITMDVLRALGWAIPASGAESWLAAALALPARALSTGGLRAGKAGADYLSEEMTRLFPAVAFEQIGCDLLRLVDNQAERRPTPFEAALAEDIDALLFVRLPQLPSSRAWGDFPVASNAEYRRRIPADPEKRKIIPLPTRPFPAELHDPDAPRERLLHSDWILIAWIAVLAAALTLAFWSLL